MRPHRSTGCYAHLFGPSIVSPPIHNRLHLLPSCFYAHLSGPSIVSSVVRSSKTHQRLFLCPIVRAINSQPIVHKTDDAWNYRFLCPLVRAINSQLQYNLESEVRGARFYAHLFGPSIVRKVQRQGFRERRLFLCPFVRAINSQPTVEVSVAPVEEVSMPICSGHQ